MIVKDLFKQEVSTTREKLLAAAAFGATLLIFAAMVAYAESEGSNWQWGNIIAWIFTSHVCVGQFLYYINRYGYFDRLRSHRPVSDEEREVVFSAEAPSLVFLIPSYKEEIAVIRQTLLSAALQDYPSRRVVLLIDDPANPKTQYEREQLERARALPGEIEALLATQRHCYANEWLQFAYRKERGKLLLIDECHNLAKLHKQVANWFAWQEAAVDVRTHVDEAFVTLTYSSRVEKHKRRAAEAEEGLWDSERVEKEYRYLSTLFAVELTTFERKRYDNLSHASNKAMNINSYISLMGKSWSELQEDGCLLLVEEKPDVALWSIPNDPYVGMIDADTLLSSDYAAQLIHVMEQDERIAVAQTPPSAFPHPNGALERIAGATIDIAFVYNQGTSFFDAAFWVGANAITRKDALDSIAQCHQERGYLICKYIEDRTVIEDTESSIDLVARGWSIYNYPERLSYSATPEDFGSLLIQRRRWANGGILILPQLFKYLCKRQWNVKKVVEAFIRFQYLVSGPIMLLLVLLLALVPPTIEGFSLWAFFLGLPYLLLYGWEIKLLGYHFSDVWRVMALNIVLIPVNAGGILKSVQQLVTGKQIPFCRTPKVIDRTAVPPGYVLIETFFLTVVFIGLYNRFVCSGCDSIFFLFLFACVLPFVYGYCAFLGCKNNLDDLMPLWYRCVKRFGQLKSTIRAPITLASGADHHFRSTSDSQ